MSSASDFFGPTSSGTTSSNGASGVIPDPYVMYSSLQMPVSIEQVLRLCEWVWLNSLGQYKMAMQRIGRYFLTKVVFDGVSDTEKKKYEEFFNDSLGIMTKLSEIADDFLCYGNSFTSLYLPFDRILICSKCNFVRNIDKIEDEQVSIDFKNLHFTAYCPRCKQKLKHEHKDLRSTDESRIHMIRWNPHEIQILHNYISGDTEYMWNITQEYRTNIKAGKMFFIKSTPWEVIESIAKGTYFRFNKDVVFHMKEPVIAGVRSRGWGIPRMLSAYKEIFYVQVLKRFNEAIALDFIVPFRLMTPKNTPGIDPLMQSDLGKWAGSMKGLLAAHRKDPAGYHTAPFPIEYQVLGGEGQQIAPWQLIKQGTSDLMDALGVPVELFQGTLNLQSAPVALRLFESSWPHLVSSLNSWLNWVGKSVAALYGWPEANIHLEKVTLADNIERKSMLLQMASAQQVSKQTAFGGIGIDPFEEQKRMMEETKEQQEQQEEFEDVQKKRQELQDTMATEQQGAAQPQQAMQQQQGGQGTPQPGGPGMVQAGAGTGPITPQDLLATAQQSAQQLMGMDSTSRRQQLNQLRNSNQVLWSAVKGQLQLMESKAAGQGVQQARQQAQQGQPPQ